MSDTAAEAPVEEQDVDIEAPVEEQDVDTTNEELLDVDALLAESDIELDDEDDDEDDESNLPFLKHEESETLAISVKNGKIQTRYVKVSIACWKDDQGNPFVKTTITMRKTSKSSYKTEKTITPVYPAVKALADRCRRMFEMRFASKFSD